MRKKMGNKGKGKKQALTIFPYWNFNLYCKLWCDQGYDKNTFETKELKYTQKLGATF